MTQAQFDKRVTELGFERAGFLGYYRLPKPYHATSVSVLNAGKNRRNRLAYLLMYLDREEQKHGMKGGTP
jgi:hypothetical protein